MCLCKDTKSCAPDQSLDCLRAAEHYGEQFVETSSQQLRSLDTAPGDVAVHLACSRLLTVLAFAFFGINQQYHGVTIADNAAWTWLHMLRGSAVMHKRYQDSVNTVSETLANELMAGSSTPRTTTQSYKLSSHFRYIEQTHQDRFASIREALAARSSVLDVNQADDVDTAICALDSITEELCSNRVLSLLHSLCLWPCRIPKGFVDMLVSGNLLALAVHAHWLMFVVLAEDVWFIGGMVEVVSARLRKCASRTLRQMSNSRC